MEGELQEGKLHRLLGDTEALGLAWVPGPCHPRLIWKGW